MVMEVILVIKSHLNLFRTGIASTNYKSDMLYNNCFSFLLKIIYQLACFKTLSVSFTFLTTSLVMILAIVFKSSINIYILGCVLKLIHVDTLLAFY